MHKAQPSHSGQLVLYECQLAELAQEASFFFELSDSEAPRPDHHAVRSVYDKLLAWNSGTVQDFLLGKGLLPSFLALE